MWFCGVVEWFGDGGGCGVVLWCGLEIVVWFCGSVVWRWWLLWWLGCGLEMVVVWF